MRSESEAQTIHNPIETSLAKHIYDRINNQGLSEDEYLAYANMSEDVLDYMMSLEDDVQRRRVIELLWAAYSDKQSPFGKLFWHNTNAKQAQDPWTIFRIKRFLRLHHPGYKFILDIRGFEALNASKTVEFYLSSCQLMKDQLNNPSYGNGRFLELLKLLQDEKSDQSHTPFGVQIASRHFPERSETDTESCRVYFSILKDLLTSQQVAVFDILKLLDQAAKPGFISPVTPFAKKQNFVETLKDSIGRGFIAQNLHIGYFVVACQPSETVVEYLDLLIDLIDAGEQPYNIYCHLNKFIESRLQGEEVTILTLLANHKDLGVLNKLWSLLQKMQTRLNGLILDQVTVLATYTKNRIDIFNDNTTSLWNAINQEDPELALKAALNSLKSKDEKSIALFHLLSTHTLSDNHCNLLKPYKELVIAAIEEQSREAKKAIYTSIITKDASSSFSNLLWTKRGFFAPNTNSGTLQIVNNNLQRIRAIEKSAGYPLAINS